MSPLGQRGRLGLAAAAVAAGLGGAAALLWGGYDVPAELLAPTLVLNLAVGWSFIGMGVVAWTRRPDSRTGLLMVVLGFAWFARLAVAVATTAGFVVGVLSGSLYLSVLAHLLVTFPTGRLTSGPRRAVVAVAYLLSVPLDALFLFLLGAQRGSGRALPPNGIVITLPSSDFGRPTSVDLVVQAVVELLCLALLALVFAQWRRAGSVQRRSLTPGLLGGVVIVATLIVERAGFFLFLSLSPVALVLLAWSAKVVLVVWPAGLLVGLLRSHLDRSAVGQLMIELGAGLPPPDRLRAVLAHTLHDPSLELGYWLPEQQAYVDSRGATVRALPPPDGRGVTYLERDGDRIAVLVHDAALAGEPELVDAVAAGAGLAVENERLHAEVRAQLTEVRASRARIVEAADAARRRVERDLHDGAQQRLVSVALALRLARSQLARSTGDEVADLLHDASAELDAALAELRELARGIYPVLLTDAGLGPALASLADRSPVPAVLAAAPAGRLPEPVEETCYFVVSEALANAAKHAVAREVTIQAREHDGHMAVEIADDGVGGADPSGSGLRGIADRVAALGGRLSIDSPAGRGTRIVAVLPCG